MQNFHTIDHIQTAVIVIDKNMTIIEANTAFQQRHNIENTDLIHSKCFYSAYQFYEQCCYKDSISCPAEESFKTKKTASAIHHFWIKDKAVVEQVTTTPIIEKNGEVNYVVEEFRDITQLLGLNKGIISVCSHCKKIRDKDGQWLNFDVYMHKYTGANFSHGICEECTTSFFSDIAHKESS